MVTNTPPPAPIIAPAPTPTKAAPNPQSDMGSLPSLSSYQLQSFNSPTRRKLLIGTQVKARLVNPIAWAGDGKDGAFSGNGSPAPKFIARLEQPLKDSDGNQVIPEGAELVVAVRSLEPNSGMAELTALQLIIDNQEFAPPLGALTLRGANGNPLLADKFQDKGKDIAAADRAMFFFGALSKVGELLNRSDSSVVITANGSSSSTTSGNANILGGVLQGGFGALAQQQQQRNQSWYQEILRRPDIRYIPAGKELSLYVNQTVTL
jgi:Bacterial conjugation TrbI-like protein